MGFIDAGIIVQSRNFLSYYDYGLLYYCLVLTYILCQCFFGPPLLGFIDAGILFQTLTFLLRKRHIFKLSEFNLELGGIVEETTIFCITQKLCSRDTPLCINALAWTTSIIPKMRFEFWGASGPSCYKIFGGLCPLASSFLGRC